MTETNMPSAALLGNEDVVQCVYLLPGLGDRTVICYYVVGYCQPLLAARLRGENATRLFFGFRIPCE